MDMPLKDFNVDVDFNFKNQIDKIINLHFFRKLPGKHKLFCH